MNEFKIKNGLIVSGSADIEQNLTVRGTLTADQYNVSIVSTSILYESGSTKFGDSLDDLHEFTGSVAITGSISLNGQPIGTGKLDESTFNSYTSSISSSIGGLSSSISTSIGGLSSSIATTDLNQNNRLNSLESASGSIRSDFNSFTSSYRTGSFTGSFIGDGSQLVNIPSSGVTGLNLNKIISGSVSASISPNRGLEINTKTIITGSITLAKTEDPDPSALTTQATHLFVSASNNQTGEDLYFRQQDNLVKWKWFEGKLNTGILWGGNLSYSGSTIYVKKGSGIILDQRASATSEISPITHYVNWNDITASCLNLTSSLATYVGIDISGSLYQQNNYFSVNQYRETIPLGMFNHTNKSTITSLANDVITAYDDVNQTSNFIQAFGPMKLNGLTMAAQTGNLQLSIGSGESFIYGGFYQLNPNDASHKITSPVVTPQIARVRRDGNGSFIVDNNNGAFYTTIDPGYYDDGDGTLASVGGSYTIQRVFFNPFTNRVHVYYGQTQYGNKTLAVQGVSTDPFVEAEYTSHQYVFLGYLIVKGNTSDLSDTATNTIIQSGLFRNTVGASASSVQTLATLHDLSDVDIATEANGDLLSYNSTTGKWVHGKSLTGNYQITGSLTTLGQIHLQDSSSYFNILGNSFGQTYLQSVNGALVFQPGYGGVEVVGDYASLKVNGNIIANNISGSFTGSGAGLYNIPASGVTGLQLNKIINNNASASIDETGLYVNRDLYVDGIITAKEYHTDYITSSVLFQSGSTKLGDSFLDTHQFTGSVLINGNVNATSITGSINFNNLTDLPALLSGSIPYSGLTNIPTGIVSGSEQLTSSYDSRYVLSGSITQTTWDNIASKPSGIVSGSSQILDLGFLQTGSFNTYTSSANSRLDSIESNTGSYAADRYLYTQDGPTGSWVINHNLNYKFPNVDVYDSNDEQLIPQKIKAVSINSVQIDFIAPTSGHAIISVGGQRATYLFNETGSYYNTQNNIGITGSLVVTGDVDGASFNSTSDSKLKIDLIKIEGALDKIEKLNGYTFNWLEEYSKDRTRQIGMLADEVYKVQPELISKRSILLGGKEEEIKLLDYAKVNTLLVEGIKELTKRVIKLENKNKKK